MSDYLAYISKIHDLSDNLQSSLDFIRWKDQVKKGSTVFIKPNFTYPFYKEGITTTPELLALLLEILKDRAGHVIVGESNGGNHSFTADDSFLGHKMHEICKKSGASLVNLSDLPRTRVEEDIQGKRVWVELPELLLNEVDSFISVPVLKVHVMTELTLSIKNLWGCYPDTMRCLHHKHLAYKLALLTKLLGPRLVIIDGIYALDGHGPMYGTPRKTNLLIAANNPVVADSLGAHIMGIPLLKVRHILLAEREGLGTTDLDKVTMNTRLEPFQMQFSVDKTFIDNLSVPLFNSEIIAKLVMDSPLKSLTYTAAKFLRNSDEHEVARQMKNQDENAN